MYFLALTSPFPLFGKTIWNDMPTFEPARLQKKYHIGKKKATRLHQVLSYWNQAFDQINTPYNYKSRLRRCTMRFSTMRVNKKLANYRCKMKICPWCRALVFVKMYCNLIEETRNGLTCIVREGLPMDKKRLLRAPRGCIASIRNIVWDDWEPLLKVCFFMDNGKGIKCTQDELLYQLTDILAWPHTFILGPHLNEYLELSKNLNFFSLGRKLIQTQKTKVFLDV